MKTAYKLHKNYQNFTNFLLDIKQHFSQNTTTIHKARNELKVLEHNNTQVVVKSFKVPNIINKIAYTFFRDSKAKKSYEYSLRLGEFAPEPIGYIEFFRNGLLDESYFVSTKFVYDFTIREPLLQKDFPNREAIFKAFGEFTLKLHDAGIFHYDYSPGNILIKEQNGTYIFKIVDVNRMGFFTLTNTQRAQNFSKLWASDDDLRVIALAYVKKAQLDDDFVEKTLYYNLQNKKRKNFKKRLKGKEIDW